jgi:ribosomal protein S18 acetylase RimI-like enzyme
MNIIFERAKPEDALQLIEVQNLGFLEDYEKYGECPSYQEKEENMLDMIENAIVYKIIGDGKIIGDIIVRNRGNGAYYLRTISVIPQFQNLGIGTKAIEFIEKDNSDGTVWFLTTPEQSYRNRHFYEKLGYRNVGEDNHSERLTLIKYQKEMNRV